MTETCTFFKKVVFSFEDNELRGDRGRGPTSTEEVFICKHKHSPVSRVSIGGPKLKCNGDMDNCPLSEEKFLDMI